MSQNSNLPLPSALTEQIQIICAWCTKKLNSIANSQHVGHGICPACASKLLTEIRGSRDRKQRHSFH